MTRRTKRVKRAVRRAATSANAAFWAVMPHGLRARTSPTARYLDMLLLDHLIVRLAFPNLHKLSDEAWRAAQPLPHQIAPLTRLGIRTVVNLRGKHDKPTYDLEREACARAGLAFTDFRVKSRDAPSKDELRGARELFERLEYPVLFHCKSGADRVGLMSALYLHLRRGVPIAQAKEALSLKYGHLRQADTGVLDYFFERYLKDTAEKPMAFFEWVETVYDPAELKRTFRAKGWANRLINGVLHRE
jgi:uncharacterized protein (TIGR01244 family)